MYFLKVNLLCCFEECKIELKEHSKNYFVIFYNRKEFSCLKKK